MSTLNQYLRTSFIFFVAKRLMVFLTLLFPLDLLAQITLKGSIVDAGGIALEGAVVKGKAADATQQTYSSKEGRFILEGMPNGPLELTISLLGYKTDVQVIQLERETPEITIAMQPDPLDLEGIIVTGTFDHRSKLASSVAITTMNSQDIAKRGARGTADLLKAIPGTFVDASAGEMYTRVYSRGISSSAEDDHGWFYVTLQEDGMPVAATQHTFYSPDLFHRVDLTTQRLEAIRGGSASITSMNAPGGIYNFISKTGQSQFGGIVQLTGALQGENNPLFRLDANFNGPLPAKNWTYNIGGFYRFDDGPRNNDVNWGNGGQLKASVTREFSNGFLRFYGKFLNDKVNRYQGVVARNWDNPIAAFDQDLNHSAVALPNVKSEIANGLGLNTGGLTTRSFDTNNGVLARDLALGFEIFHEFNSGWTLRNQIKYTKKTTDWQTSIGNQRIGLESFLPYVLSGSAAPWGQVVFRDAQTDEVLAKVNNLGALAAFQGEIPSFEYIEGSLPNDGVLGSAPWQKEDKGRDVMFQMSLGNTLGKHSLNARLFVAHSAVETHTVGSFAFATFENEPRMLRVTLENPGSAVEQLSDAAGITNYGGLFYRHAKADVSQAALALEDVWKINDQWTLDAGLRYELVAHIGDQDRFLADTNLGGVDGDTLTAYDSGVRGPVSRPDRFKFNYNYLSFSIGGNYQFNDQMAVFARFTYGNKAPELSYYFNNFANINIDRPGKTQRIWQGELGLKVKSKYLDIFTTVFWSRLDNISFSDFVFDQSTGSTLFYTPEQLNQTTTLGLEIEGNLSLFRNFDIQFIATIQNPKATRFTFYDAKGNSDISDDEIIIYSGNELPHNPKVSLEVTPSYSIGRNNIFVTWRYLGKRQANIANAFQLNGFSQFNAGISTRFAQHFSAMFIVNNVLNSAGLMNFFGANEFGGNANGVSTEFVVENPDATFIVVPVLPRMFMLKLAYEF